MQLETVGRQLIDIHSQHQNQLLQDAAYQLRIIDSLAGNCELLQEYGRRFKALRDARRRYAEARERIEKTRDDEEFIRFQLQQLDTLDLVDGEQEELERQRELLANMSDIKSALNTVLDALTNADNNALSCLSTAVDGCEELSSVLEEADSLAERLESARVEIKVIAETLSDYDSDLQADPLEQEAVEDRLNAIYSLQHRHKVSTVGELIALRDALKERLDDIDSSDNTLEELQREVKRTKALARETARNHFGTRQGRGNQICPTAERSGFAARHEKSAMRDTCRP